MVKLPPLNKYDEKGDPIAHLLPSKLIMSLYNIMDMIMYRVFVTTLTPSAMMCL